VFLVSDTHGTYAKERVVRVPATVRWTGPTHEMLDGQRPGESRRLPGVRFSELDKDADALKRKSQRDVAVLKRYTRQHPKAPRWFYYLGDAHQALGEHAAAIEAYRACAALGGWAEEGAWACYRAAQCCCELKRWPDAIHLCAAGLAIRPATAELAWLAGYAAYHARRYDDAIAWSNMAIANGAADGAAARFERVGFRHLPGLHEGPYDVLRWTYKALGDAANEAEAARRFERARSERGGDAAKGSSPRAS
jgi:tetratricopeptide (TPR) repeat protein